MIDQFILDFFASQGWKLDTPRDLVLVQKEFDRLGIPLLDSARNFLTQFGFLKFKVSSVLPGGRIISEGCDFDPVKAATQLEATYLEDIREALKVEFSPIGRLYNTGYYLLIDANGKSYTSEYVFTYEFADNVNEMLQRIIAAKRSKKREAISESNKNI